MGYRVIIPQVDRKIETGIFCIYRPLCLLDLSLSQRSEAAICML